MLLLEGDTDAIVASISVQAEGAETVGGGVLFGGDEDRSGGGFAEGLADCGFNRWGEKEFGLLLEKDHYGT